MSAEASRFAFDGNSVYFDQAFQPIVDVSNRRIYAYEALLRGSSGSRPEDVFCKVPPEHTKAFHREVRQSAIERAAQCGLREKLSLNISTSCMIADHKAVLETLDHAAQCGIAAHDVIIEISESEVIHGNAGLKETLNTACARGALIALDDFGAGYAGLNSLIDVNPDIIKLDMYLIRHIESSGPRQATVKALVGLALDLGIELIAEGVETEAEFAFLQRAGISLFQGFYFAVPQIGHLPRVEEINV